MPFVHPHLWIFSMVVLCAMLSYTNVTSHSCPANYEHGSCSQDAKNKYTHQELTDEELFARGHLKPFGSHRPPEMVEELPFMISPEDFYMKYVVKHKPVVIKGGAKRWPAYKLWTDEYLNHTYGDVMFKMETKDDDKYNIPTGMRMREFLEVYQDANRYLVDELTVDMRKEVVLPLCLRCEEMDKYFFVSYFWFSQGNTSSTIHLDTDENLLCVMRGHKEVIMVSPEYSTDLYADSSRVLGVLDINVTSVDLLRYPRVKYVRYVKAIVDEGDMVYIPQMWWHQVYSRAGRQQAVAFWWKSKPWLRNGVRKSFLFPGSQQEERKKLKYSYANVLAGYEQWVQNVSDNQPMIACKEQQVLMSEYKFESNYGPDDEQTLGDGGDLEEEDELKYQSLKQAGLTEKNQAHSPPQLPCDFDRQNVKSPCSFEPCQEDEEDLKCVRYILDYCEVFQDRGCVIHLPHLLNKLDKGQYEELKSLETDFG